MNKKEILKQDISHHIQNDPNKYEGGTFRMKKKLKIAIFESLRLVPGGGQKPIPNISKYLSKKYDVTVFIKNGCTFHAKQTLFNSLVLNSTVLYEDLSQFDDSTLKNSKLIEYKPIN